MRRTVPLMSRAQTPGQRDHLAPVEDQRGSAAGFAPQFDDLGVNLGKQRAAAGIVQVRVGRTVTPQELMT